MLFLGELETGREVVSLGRTLALPVAEETIAAFGARAERAQIELVLLAGSDVELPLRPRMLRVVIENLVANSLRYAGPGSRCTVSILQEGARPLLIVSDNGKGVSESDVPRLFERFYRADQARSSRGTGLGLAIVKHIVTSADGTVEATGAPGRGLEIVCRFPAADVPSACESRRPTQAQPRWTEANLVRGDARRAPPRTRHCEARRHRSGCAAA